MTDMIYDLIINPIMAASGGEFSAIGIVAKLAVFLFTLFVVMYGLPILMLLMS